MKAFKMFGIVLGVALFIFTIASIASAQTYDGLWWKVKASFDGVQISETGAVVEDNFKGSGTIYINTELITKTVDTTEVTGYNFNTCTESVVNGDWITATSFIDLGNTYGGVTILDFFNTETDGIVIDNGESVFKLYPVLAVKIKSSSKASFSTVTCSGDAAGPKPLFALVSCDLSGQRMTDKQIAKKVPAACRP